MIKATFYSKNKSLVGFEIKGHSGYGEEGTDIICASVSSAAYMTANTITEVIGEKAQIEVQDGYLKLLASGGNKDSELILKGLKLHVNALADDYSQYIVCSEKSI